MRPEHNFTTHAKTHRANMAVAISQNAIARQADVQMRIDDLRNSKDIPEYDVAIRKEHILVRMQKLVPGY